MCILTFVSKYFKINIFLKAPKFLSHFILKKVILKRKVKL